MLIYFIVYLFLQLYRIVNALYLRLVIFDTCKSICYDYKHDQGQGIFLDFSEAKVSIQATVAPEVEMGGWKPVKKERVPFSDRRKYDMVQKKKEPHIEKVF